MKYLAVTLAAAAGMAALSGGPASADLYPIAPPGTSVTLQPSEFIQSVPQSFGVSYPNPLNQPNGDTVIGDDIERHPGAVFNSSSSFLIGVFGGPIDTSPGADVFVWHTGRDDFPFTGPLIQLGHWDDIGKVFTSFGNTVATSFLDTGVSVPVVGFFGELSSSITPVSAFGVDGIPFLNAVELTYNNSLGSDNRVTGVAANLVPEPSTMLFFGSGLACLVGYGWQRKKQQQTVISKMQDHKSVRTDSNEF
jgi:hypothetical protein